MRKEDKLTAKWSRKEQDLIVSFPLGVSTNTDANWLCSVVFNKDFEKELRQRGYDISSLAFSVEPMRTNPKFASQR